MSTKKSLKWFVLLIFACGLLAACGHSTVQIGFVQNKIGDHWNAHYNTFIGTKSTSVKASAGQTLTLNYDVTVTKGELGLKVTNPSGDSLWEVNLQDDSKDTVQIPIDQDGRYTIAITGKDDNSGSWDITWAVK